MTKYIWVEDYQPTPRGVRVGHEGEKSEMEKEVKCVELIQWGGRMIEMKGKTNGRA